MLLDEMKLLSEEKETFESEGLDQEMPDPPKGMFP